MANGGFFGAVGRAFGLTKSKGQGQAPARTKRVTPLQTEGGQFLNQTLRDRIAGKDLGLSKDLTDASSAAFATRQRKGFERVTAPAISASASARGLGKSTIPLNREALERQKVEESISERIANLGLASEELASREKSTAIGRFGQLTQAETNAQNAEVQAENMFNNAEFLRQQGFREAADKKQQEAIKLLSAAGLPIAGGAISALAGPLANIPIVGGALSAGATGIGEFATNLGATLGPPAKKGLFDDANITFSGAKAGEAATVNFDKAIENFDGTEEEKEFLRSLFK